MKTYNKGEWSELYAICSILQDRIIKVADSDLRPTGEIIKVLQLLMGSMAGEAEYDITDENGDISVIVDGEVVKKLKLDSEKVSDLLNGIALGSGRSFSVPVGDSLMNDLMLVSFKTNSYQKSDLNTKSIMPNETTPRTVGFSVKSQVGAMPTLLNASQATNFIFEVEGFNGDIEAVNAIEGSSKIKDRLNAIRDAGGSFVYSDTENQTFQQNLRMTDSLLPDIIAYMLLDFFGGRGTLTLEDASERVVGLLPFQTTELEVKTKIKTFLSNITLGMVPTREWDGSELGGGCIFVKNDGDIVCFTLYDRDAFKEYLIKNTKFDTASSSRNKFGVLYRDEATGRLFFNLNLDIRMI